MKPIRINPLAKMIWPGLNRLSFKPKSFSLGCEVERSENILICMPTNIDRCTVARDLLSNFAEVFRPRQVCFLLPFLEAEGYLVDSPDYRIIQVKKDDLGLFSLPGRHLIRKVKRMGFGMSLDLDLENGFFNRHLCFKCGIPLRIGPKRKGAFPLYNLQLAPIQDRPRSQETYQGMIHTLKTLFSTGGLTTSDAA
jgi:hypothetical protein